ncbi:MAG: hypothetical protein AB7N76_04065 [Planctomycetota bacterium]
MRPACGAPLLMLGALALAGCAGQELQPCALGYEVRAEPEELAVEITIEGECPRAWSLSGVEPRELEVEGAEGGPARVRVRDGRALLPPGTRRVRYRYPVLALLRRSGHHSLSRGAGGRGSYMLEGSTYLLTPREVAAGSRVALSVRGLPALLPWELAAPTGEGPRAGEPRAGEASGGGERRDDEAPRRRELAPRDLRNLGHHAFGSRRRTIEVGGARLELGFVAGALEVSDDQACAAIAQAAREVLSARPSGTFPWPRLQVVLVPAPASWEPAPFGQVLWSRPQSVALYLGEHAPNEELQADWTAVHELCHTLHPRILPGSTWLTEGVATYYQCVTRIRSGRRSEDAMWGAMAWGLEHGQAEAGDLPLPELSRRIHELHAYRGVYWGGAFLMLDLDLALRARGKSLDGALEALQARGPTDLAGFARGIDAYGGAGLWDEVSGRHLRGPTLARGAELLARLGYELDGRPRADFADAGPRALRAALAARKD